MDLCGEHGNKDTDTIAYNSARGPSCPACYQIEQMEAEHEEKVNLLEAQLEDRNSNIDELESEIQELRDASN